MSEQNQLLQEILGSLRDLRSMQQKQSDEISQSAMRIERVHAQLENVTRMNSDLTDVIRRSTENKSTLNSHEEKLKAMSGHENRIKKLENGYFRLATACVVVVGILEIIFKIYDRFSLFFTGH